MEQATISSAETSRRTFFLKTRRGKVIKLVHEKFIRPDLGVASLHGNIVSPDQLRDLVREAPYSSLIVVDTNILLHQIDVLEKNSPATSLILIPQTALGELRNLNLSVFRRVQSLLKNETRSFLFMANEIMTQTVTSR